MTATAPKVINGSAKRESINGTAGNDILIADLGGSIAKQVQAIAKLVKAQIQAVLGNMTLKSTPIPRAKTSKAVSKDDVLRGGAGNDTIVSTYGNDIIDAGAGNDRIVGGTGNDQIRAGRGNDVIMGGAGRDEIFGEAGNDVISGGAGNDFIRAFDKYKDFVDGGAGKDSARLNKGKNVAVAVEKKLYK